MTDALMTARIRGDNDQDREHCREWFRRATREELLLVWEEIQAAHTDPAKEVVSRLAQLAFCEMYVEVRHPIDEGG